MKLVDWIRENGGMVEFQDKTGWSAARILGYDHGVMPTPYTSLTIYFYTNGQVLIGTLPRALSGFTVRQDFPKPTHYATFLDFQQAVNVWMIENDCPIIIQYGHQSDGVHHRAQETIRRNLNVIT